MDAANDNRVTGDRRRTRRRRSLLQGKLVSLDGATSFDCTVRDLSRRGARVRLSGAARTPAEGVLIVVRGGLAHDAQVAWSDGADLGLRFRRTRRLAGAVAPELADVRRLWTALDAGRLPS